MMDYDLNPEVFQYTQLPDDDGLPYKSQIAELALKFRNEHPDPSFDHMRGRWRVTRERHNWGSNAVYSVTWEDGIWAVLVPLEIGLDEDGNRLATSEHDLQRHLESTAKLMEYLNSHTTIPIPKVLTWNTGPGIPYILTEYPQGRSAIDLWYETACKAAHGFNTIENDTKRYKLL
ncbi:hypothetical protein N656DRAFT_785438 [Canariomyces notabilis]|uniref:Aminoglycoside phosphotransferase domain-containing protein n=1 Tax=Canariomyces notabilis TaxID=2074819 RepID=A0AAN6T7W3_9PEZI|nr:hypothetical protein N656DRAFT_785438 [Canariomyces arenarius]